MQTKVPANRSRGRTNLSFVLFLFWLLIPVQASAGMFSPQGGTAELTPDGRVLNTEALMKHCAPRVAMSTMDKLAFVESRWNAYAININYRGWRLERQPRSKDEAIVTLKHLLDQYGKLPKFSLDVGAGQVNTNNVERLGLSLPQLFDVCTNLRAAQTILVDCYLRARTRWPNEQTALAASLSCYNTGNFSGGFRNGYVHKVYRAPVSRPKGGTTPGWLPDQL